MKALASFLAALFLSGCGDIPKDLSGTLDRIRAERQFKVGLIETSGPFFGAGERREFIAGVAAASGANPTMETGAAEPLLMKLEGGELDLVIGPFAPKSPWGKQVTLLPPLTERVTGEEPHLHLVAAARNGENAWIGLLYREARQVAGRAS